jgi:pimeloyl-ACP methyl ester carboxylesterase
MKIRIAILALTLIILSCKGDKAMQVETTNHSVINKLKQMNKETITFPSLDGLTITADVYKVDNNPITVLLCHQAGFSRGEYKDTAMLLNSYGYSVIAIDQRSGDGVNDVVNETAKLAKSKDMATEYIDGKPDIIAAIDYVYSNNGNTKLLLVGSSYSATLAMLISENNNKIYAVAAFSPGEYFKGMDIQNEIKDLQKPTFVTASLSETRDLTVLVRKMNTKNLFHYKPTAEGIHGSRVLWGSTKGYSDYRMAFKAFLEKI